MNIVLHRFSVLLYDSVRSKKEGREKRKKRDEIGGVVSTPAEKIMCDTRRRRRLSRASFRESARARERETNAQMCA